MAKAKKMAAERRAQAKCAAARSDAADAPTAAAGGPSSSTPTQSSAPAPPPPELPAPVTACATLQHRPARSAASVPSLLQQSLTKPCAVGTAPTASAPRLRPRDLFALAADSGRPSHPWVTVRRRRQCRSRPHRHERQPPALVQAEHERRMWDCYHHEDVLIEQLRDACYAGLGSLYQSGDIRGYGFCAPAPVEYDRPSFTPRDEFECFPEILSVMICGEEVLAPGPRTLQEQCDTAAEFQHCLEGLQSSVWDAFLVVHSFLVCTEAHWQQRRLPEMQRLYIAGVHSWFFGDGG
ncbi:hypothetical protein EXIGLDRAFT_777387 [Exidia glandulosa HHB12029]|uniref:Uncharacterized protein n=1 Tax=Exidia glandulosa HHB12029 TaxID=1314781 RepID=A0A165D1I7_EXIGL|nr:hypothetical protein EXIGLDRAFT_777387 [Exidia glandulosa HHB12029]